MKWRHNGLPNGRISFGLRQSAEIVNGVFEAPDDPALTERLKKAGHTPIEDAPAPPQRRWGELAHRMQMVNGRPTESLRKDGERDDKRRTPDSGERRRPGH